MRRLSNLALLALLPATAVAQRADPKMEWEEFLTENGRGSWSVMWNPATGTPDAIYGKGLATGGELTTIEAGRVEAEALLKKYADLLGMGDSKFVELDSSKIRHLLYFNYGQRYKGLEVRGGRADVRINTNGVVAMFGSSAVDIPLGFTIKPTISAAAARKIAEQKVLGRAGQAGRQTRLVIWAQPSGRKVTRAVLAWEVEINEIPKELAAGKSFIDAATGDVLEYENGVVYCGGCGKSHPPRLASEERLAKAMAARKTLEANVDASAPPLAITGTVMAWTNTGHKPTDPLKNVPLPNLHVTSILGSTTTDKNGKFSISSGTANVTVSATLWGIRTLRVRVSSGTQMSVTQSIKPGTPGIVQFGTATMGDTLKSQTTCYYFTNDVNEYVRTLVPNKPTQFAQLDRMNPIVNIPSSCNAYYTNFTINFYSKSAKCNMTAYETIIQHEWGHGLDHAFGGIVLTDGLSEGWADVICILRSQQPEVGPSFYLPPRNPVYVRTATNSRAYPASGGVHEQGQVWMGWVWDVRTDIATRVGIPAAQIITERIVIPTIVANAANLEKQVLEVFLLDDDDGDLRNGTPNYVALEKASLKRNINFPKIDAGTLNHKPLGTSEMQLTPRIIRAVAKPVIGTFTRVELTFDTGSGPQTRSMVPSGTPDEYIALIPGVLSPKEVKYSILATHSTSKTLRSPTAGDHNYSIGREVVFFTDDFEKASGWTTGTLKVGPNDWQRGSPSGASGTFWGVKWADPKGAFSGNYSWGNNLSGSYLVNMSAYLRSPKLNLTGKTNVRLRYYRWLTTQMGYFDKAEVYVNSTKVWNNILNVHTNETGWQKSDIRLAAADNNPSVYLDWRLTTDGNMQLGGWNIDDVTLYAFHALPAPKFTMDINPSQVDLGKTSTVTFTGTANKLILILVAASPGPTNIPSIPTLHVGAPFGSFPAALNNSGKLTLMFNAPTSSSATGTLTYVHALEQTSPSTLTASNAGVVLWGK